MVLRRCIALAYQRKTRDEYDLLGNWGYGWDYLLTEDSVEKIKLRLKEYRENDPRADYKIEKHRILIDKKV